MSTNPTADALKDDAIYEALVYGKAALSADLGISYTTFSTEDGWGRTNDKAEQLRRIEAAIETRVAFAKAGGAAAVIVKPLEWGSTSYGRPEAKSVIGVYRINGAMSGGWSVTAGARLLQDHDGRENFATMGAAKAAAEADYTARILSVIAPRPVPDMRNPPALAPVELHSNEAVA
jgi:hypothetical protein